MKNQTDKTTVEELVRMRALDGEPFPDMLISVFQNTPTADPSAEKTNQVLEKLKEAVTKHSTFGELVSQHLTKNSLSVSKIAQATEIPEQIIQGLMKDAVLPFSVPVVLMKRFVQQLGVQFDQALNSLELTASTLADTLIEDEPLTMKVGVSARRGYEISLSELEPKTLRDRNSILQSNERYLQRLKELLTRG